MKRKKLLGGCRRLLHYQNPSAWARMEPIPEELTNFVIFWGGQQAKL